MPWYVPDFIRSRRTLETGLPAYAPTAIPADFDVWLSNLRDLRVAVPCCGCDGSHEMTGSEILARQLIGGGGWSIEECDQGSALRGVLSPEDVAACGGDVFAVRALLSERGVLCSDTLNTDATNPGATPHRILLSV